jgi:membrane protease YdiL (CAAX protease family)
MDLAAFLVFAVFSLVVVRAAVLAIRGENTVLTGTVEVLISGAIILSWMAFICFWIVWVRGYSLKAYLSWNPYPYRLQNLIGLGVLLAFAGPMFSSLFPSETRTPMEQLAESEAIYVLAALGIVVAPIAEEIIFRGFLFRIFSDIAGGMGAVIITTLLFAGSHAPQLWGDWASIAVILGVGTVLGMLRRLSNSVATSFVVHLSYNTTLIVVGALAALLGYSTPAR